MERQREARRGEVEQREGERRKKNEEREARRREERRDGWGGDRRDHILLGTETHQPSSRCHHVLDRKVEEQSLQLLLSDSWNPYLFCSDLSEHLSREGDRNPEGKQEELQKRILSIPALQKQGHQREESGIPWA